MYVNVQSTQGSLIWFRSTKNHNQFSCSADTDMKRLISKVSVNSMTDRHIDGTLLARHVVKNTLSSIRRLCGRLCQDVIYRDDKIERQNRVNEMGGELRALGMQLAEEELWNSRNENLANERRELTTKMRY